MGHRVVEAPVGMGGEAEQLGALGAQFQDLGDDPVVVVAVAIVTAAIIGAPDFLAQVAAGGEGEEGLHGGAGILDGELALVSAGLGSGCRCGAQGLGQAVEVRGLQVQHVVVLVGEDVVAELGEEGGEALVDLGDAQFGLRVELGALADEAAGHDRHEALLLLGELGLVGGVVNGLKTLEEFLVLRDLVGKLGDPRGHLLLNHLELLRREVAAPDLEEGVHSVELTAGILEGGEGVLEVRGCRVVGDCGHFVEV